MGKRARKIVSNDEKLIFTMLAWEKNTGFHGAEKLTGGHGTVYERGGELTVHWQRLQRLRISTAKGGVCL